MLTKNRKHRQKMEEVWGVWCVLCVRVSTLKQGICFAFTARWPCNSRTWSWHNTCTIVWHENDWVLFSALLHSGKNGTLPGLDRGASEDLSLQALKSDAVLWKTKGTGRGTNMVLCRPGGRCLFGFSSLVSLLLLLSVVLLSFFGLSSYASQVWGQPLVRTLGWLEKKERLKTDKGFFSSVDWACVSGDSHLCFGVFRALITGGYCGPVTLGVN